MATLLTQREAADVLRLSQRTLERWRVQGTGPRFVRLNHSIRYRPEDLDAHVAALTGASFCLNLSNCLTMFQFPFVCGNGLLVPPDFL
jgi:hypothetical protein